MPSGGKPPRSRRTQRKPKPPATRPCIQIRSGNTTSRPCSLSRPPSLVFELPAQRPPQQEGPARLIRIHHRNSHLHLRTPHRVIPADALPFRPSTTNWNAPSVFNLLYLISFSLTLMSISITHPPTQKSLSASFYFPFRRHSIKTATNSIELQSSPINLQSSPINGQPSPIIPNQVQSSPNRTQSHVNRWSIRLNRCQPFSPRYSRSWRIPLPCLKITAH